MLNYKKYGQYKSDIFNKLNYKFLQNSSILDIGCGDGSDARIFSEYYGLNVTGVDIYKNKNIDDKKLKFIKCGILDLNIGEKFDYIFLHDVIHHIDEENQSYEYHIRALKRLDNFLKPGGEIIIIEGNRYNPIFYPHMVKMLGHEHFTYRYFNKIIKDSFSYDCYDIKFKNFEAHSYPFFLKLWKLYELLMENLAPKRFLAYNIAIIKKEIK